MSDVLSIVGIISIPFIIFWVIMSLFGPNHCGGEKCNVKR